MSSLFSTAFLASFLQYLPSLISAHFFVFLENNFFRDNLSCVPLFCHEKEKKTTYRCVTIDPTNVFSISPLPRLDYTAERRTRYSFGKDTPYVFDVLLGHRNVNNLRSRVFLFFFLSLSLSRCGAKSSIEISIENGERLNGGRLIISFPFSVRKFYTISSWRGGNP